MGGREKWKRGGGGRGCGGKKERGGNEGLKEREGKGRKEREGREGERNLNPPPNVLDRSTPLVTVMSIRKKSFISVVVRKFPHP
jgi:hypothetical protein